MMSSQKEIALHVSKSKSIVELILLCVIFFFAYNFSSAGEAELYGLQIPDSLHVQIITLHDGSEVLGRITEIGDTTIVFKSSLGESRIEKSKIREIREVQVSKLKDGKYWLTNPNQTRLYFSQTGRTLKKGKWYFSDYYIFFPGIACGLSDRVTIGGGMSLFPGVDLGDQAFFFTPKIGISSSEKTNFAVGAMIISIPDDLDDDDDIPTFGFAYVVGTFGSPDASVSTGLGYGFAGSELADKPAVMLGGEYRLGNRISFVSENWIFPEADNPLVSYGFRFFGDRIAVDLGLFNVIGEDAIFPGLPWIDFVVNIR